MTCSMLDERSYLPFEVSELPQGGWLVVSPHPDDESFGMGGSILLAKDIGADVFVVMMTDGSLGGDGAQRELEAREACRRLGVKEVFFLNEKDRSLYPNVRNIEFLSNIISKNSIKSVFFPHPFEAHPDHRASAVIAWEAIVKTNFAATGYSYEISLQGPLNILVDITSVFDKKVEVMSIYGSQTPQNNYIDVVTALNKARTWSLGKEVQFAEAFYKWPQKKISLSLLAQSESKKFFSELALPHGRIRGSGWIQKLFQ